MSAGTARLTPRPACRGAWPFWTVAVAFAAAFGTYLWLFPMSHDDYWYAAWLSDFREGRTGNPWPGILESWHHRWLTDNTRLGNMLYTLLLCLPRWVCLPFNIGAVLLWVALTARLARTGTRPVWTAMGIAGLVSVLPMWRVEMSSACFQLNYLWATPIALWAACLFRDPGRWRPAALLLWGLLTGLWHEGFALPLLAGGVTMVCLRRGEYLDRRRVWLLVGLAAGILVLVSAPGLMRRAGVMNEEFMFDRMTFATSVPGPALFVALVAAAAALPRLRRAVDWSLVLYIAPAVLVGLAFLVWTRLSRGSWFGVALSIVGICHIAVAAARTYRPARPAVVALAALLFAMAALKLGFGIRGALRVQPLVGEAVERIRRAPGTSDVVFTPMTSPFAGPAESVVWPHFADILLLDYTMVWIQNYYRLDRKYYLVPDVLERVTADSGVSVPGTPGLRCVDGQYFIPVDSGYTYEPYRQIHAEVSHGPFTKVYLMFVRPFRSRGDGRTYAWLTPYVNTRYVIPFAIGSVRLDWPQTDSAR